MISKTKIKLTENEISAIFNNADLGIVKSSNPLGDGEYNAVYEVVTERGTFVLKVAPSNSTNVLTYERDMMRSEVYWYAKMRTNTNIYTPKVYFKDFSHKIYPSDYFIMEKVVGTPINKLKLTKDERKKVTRKIAEMTANLHCVTNNSFGYIQNALYPNWYIALKSMVNNIIDDCNRIGRHTKRGEKLLNYIEIYKEILAKAPCSLVNFDIWDANIIYDCVDDKMRLVWIDPERSFWGDPIFDFCCLEMMKFKLYKKIDTIDAYNAVAKKPLKSTNEEKIRYAFSLGYMALIQEVEKYYRYSPKHFGWYRNIASSALLYSEAFSVLKNEK